MTGARPALVLLALACAAGCAHTAGVPAADTDTTPHQWNIDAHALVIGVGRYDFGWPALRGATGDVAAVSDALERNHVQVQALTDPTLDEAERALAQFLLQPRGPRSHLLVYVAGHGWSEETATGETAGYLALRDTPLPARDYAGFRRRSLPLDALEELSLKSPAHQVLFMFDACFSGSLFSRQAGPVAPATDAEVKHREGLRARQFITAGDRQETVPDDSQFRRLLVGLLTGVVREPVWDGYLTGAEIGALLRDRLPAQVPPQHPQYGALPDPVLGAGDFVLRLDPAFSPPPIEQPLDVVFRGNQDRFAVYLDGRSLGTARAGELRCRLPSATYFMRAVKHLSQLRPVEESITVERQWQPQIIEVTFGLDEPPVPPP